MRNSYLSIICLALLPISVYAADGYNGDKVNGNINLSGINVPRPHLGEIAEPQAFYTVSTATLSIELDPVYYSHYTIVLQSDYACVDYYVTSPVVNIPVGSLDSVIDIYIESDDCGSYYGTLDQAAYGRSP